MYFLLDANNGVLMKLLEWFLACRCSSISAIYDFFGSNQSLSLQNNHDSTIRCTLARHSTLQVTFDPLFTKHYEAMNHSAKFSSAATILTLGRVQSTASAN